MYTRRHFLSTSLLAAAGWGLSGLGCLRRAAGPAENKAKAAASFPHLEAKGSAFDIGRAVGERFRWNIQQVFVRRREWFEGIRAFVEKDPGAHLDPFLAAVRDVLPDCLEELQGLGEGAGVEFRDLAILNLAAELEALRKKPCGCPGCSTLALVAGGRLLLAHNEDGDVAYDDIMFTVRLERTGKPAFFALVYPGLLPGNAPLFNEAGLAVTTNYIGGLSVRPGVGRYFISRAVCEAERLEDAVRLASLPERAYSFHFCAASRREKKIISVETCPEKVEELEVEGLYVHTNHLVLPGMRDIPQDGEYLEVSSMSRYRVLVELAEKLQGRLDDVDLEKLVGMLSSHEGRPTAPCRHHAPPSRGVTLACAAFDFQAGRLVLYRGNPCQERFTDVALG